MTDLPEAVKRAWHLAALSKALPLNGRLGVTIAGAPVVLFRTGDGVGALLDRCPHRNYPLSRGRVHAGGLECPYHGWRFDRSGRCVTVSGCVIPDDMRDRLAATPVRVVERHGAIFVRITSQGPEDPSLPPTLGDPGHDHFWWAQGIWKGRAYDAIENVLDPFHTGHLHHGYIRRRDRLQPVRLRVDSFGDSLEMVIEQARPDLGLMSRFLEGGDRTHSRTRYYPPTAVQARWEGRRGLTLSVSAFFTPATEDSFIPFACFTTPKGAAPGWLKQAAIRLFLSPVIAQDRRALALQAETMARFGRPQFTQGPGDILGARLHQLWVGDRLETGSDAPVAAEL